ncbi:MAG: hypothetical protein ACUVQY_10005 [Thermoproteota archaeon]
MLLVPAYSINLISGGGLRQFLNVSLYLFIALEVLSLLRWATHPLFRSEVYSDMTWFFSRFDSFLFYSFNSIFGNILILAFVFSFLAFIFPFISRVKVGNGRIGIEISKFGKSIDANQFNLKLPDEKILLLSSFLILLYLSYLPYFPFLNPSNKSVSVDIVFYADYLDKFKQLGLSGEGFDYLLGSRGERATAIFLTYLVSMVFSSSTEAVKASIFISSYLIALATYLSLKAATKKGSLAGLSAFLSVFSVQVMVGLYAGYLANMVAIPLLLLMMSCFSRAMKGEVNFFIPAVLLSTLALYSHPWSWAIYILAIFLLPLNLVLSSIGLRKRYSRREAVMVLSFILINLALDLTKQMLLKSTGGVYAEYAITRNSLSISNIFLLNRNLDELRQILVGGYTSNVLIHALSIVGVIFLLAFNDVFFDGLFLILPIAAVPFIFVNEAIQSRLLFALPTNIYATLGLYEALKQFGKNGVKYGALMILILLWLANYGFRSAANLV